MLLALMGGRALTATELALEGDISPPTASAHLAKLEAAGLIRLRKQGRHRYFQIADERVAQVIESLCGVVSQRAHTRAAIGPRNLEIRRARVCYDHLAGELAVRLFDSLVGQRFLVLGGDCIAMTPAGARALSGFGIDIDALVAARRPLCRLCLDWSERRHHLAGALGAAILSRIFERRWAQKDAVTRTVRFTAYGERALERAFGMAGVQTVARG
jgi:hypothetical protein